MNAAPSVVRVPSLDNIDTLQLPQNIIVMGIDFGTPVELEKR